MQKTLKLKDFVCNGHFDVNASYKVYSGVWNDNGLLLWRSCENGELNSTSALAQRAIAYVTVDVDSREIVVEVE